MGSQNDQLLQLIELFVKGCQYFVLLEQSHRFLITSGADPAQNLTGFKGVPKNF